MSSDDQRFLPPEYEPPVWVWWLAGLLALAGPVLLQPIWPGGWFFGGLTPTVFIVGLFAAAPSEFYPNDEMRMPPRRSIRRRGPSDWEAAWKRAFLAAGVCLMLAIIDDWIQMGFGTLF
ncbi:hypothetical protein [Brevundimonas sp. AAP58]|uniref:hypothetical protein n=1 Tax=Brevundimonas sp. AAP58 TaxID=1523422 RepID=UPI0012E2028D|nr:hypothetical protein [Brevundimonas sp. AAP58]